MLHIYNLISYIFKRGDIIYKELIKKYINYFTPTDIKNYALKENIEVSDQEITIIYNFIKNHYQELLDNDTSVFRLLKLQIRPILFDKIISLYNENKTKYLT